MKVLGKVVSAFSLLVPLSDLRVNMGPGTLPYQESSQPVLGLLFCVGISSLFQS